MSEHKSEAETNPRRSKRKRVAKLDLDCIHESGIIIIRLEETILFIYILSTHIHSLIIIMHIL